MRPIDLLRAYRPRKIEEHWFIRAMLSPLPCGGSGVLLHVGNKAVN